MQTVTLKLKLRDNKDEDTPLSWDWRSILGLEDDESFEVINLEPAAWPFYSYFKTEAEAEGFRRYVREWYASEPYTSEPDRDYDGMWVVGHLTLQPSLDYRAISRATR